MTVKENTQVTCSGTVETITFHQPDNGFCVLQVRPLKARLTTTIVGHVAKVHCGQWVDAEGVWVTSPKFGKQLRANKLTVRPPKEALGIEKYLASGLIKGVGPVYAKKLMKHFGPHVLDIIAQEPERLHEIPGLGKKRIATIIESWQMEREVHTIMVFLQSHGIGTARCVRIYKAYGKHAIAKIEENPYCLAKDIMGIGFLLADQLAQSLGIEKTDPARIQAGIVHALGEASGQGHCGLWVADLLEQAKKLLAVSYDAIQEGIVAAQEDNSLRLVTIEAQQAAYLPHLYYAEVGVSNHIKRLLNNPVPPWGKLSQKKAQKWVDQANQALLSTSQYEALSTLLQHKVCCITGGPGVGKTTIIKTLLSILSKQSVSIALAAPTGRAAKRMQESTGMEAKTIHRLLEYDPMLGGFKRDAHNPLPINCLIVDETSMVDVILMAQLLAACPDDCAVILVGDVDQLPSVGPGSVLADIIASDVLPVKHLTEIFRQARDSHIIHAAHAVNHGQMPTLDTENAHDFYCIEVRDAIDAKHKLQKILCERIAVAFKCDPKKDVQVLAPMRRGPMGIDQLNEDVRDWLNPNPDKKVTRLGRTLGEGDKVIQTINNYDKEVYNGDLGEVIAIDATEQVLTVEYDDRKVAYDFSELDEIDLAYAISIHKSQGSEYKAVIIPILMSHYPMLARNLIYTGMTRGKQLVILLVESKALNYAVKDKQKRSRFSQLSYWLSH
jgi:exodeoxyribonuclease V alpha subunit